MQARVGLLGVHLSRHHIQAVFQSELRGKGVQGQNGDSSLYETTNYYLSRSKPQVLLSALENEF